MNHKIISCISCEVAFDYNAALNHVKSCHPKLSSRDMGVNYVQACHEHGAVETLTHPTSIIPAIPGLRARSDIYWCPAMACNALRSTEESIKQHFRTVHPGQPFAGEWPTTWAQRFNANKNNRWFKVLEPPQVAALPKSPTAWIKSNFRTIKELLTPTELNPTDKRQLSPWLVINRWPEHVQNHNPHFLRELVQLPSEHEIPYLQPAVEAMYTSAYALVTSTPRIILQRLNTNDPLKE
jgi:hypothetical protein